MGESADKWIGDMRSSFAAAGNNKGCVEAFRKILLKAVETFDFQSVSAVERFTLEYWLNFQSYDSLTEMFGLPTKAFRSTSQGDDMKKGQWIKIIHMEGEPQMTGEIGQYEFTDSIGQIHGTWGIAIQPDKDSYELLTESQVAEIREEEA